MSSLVDQMNPTSVSGRWVCCDSMRDPEAARLRDLFMPLQMVNDRYS